VLSTGAVPAVLAVRDGLAGSAEEVVEGWGMLVDDRARWRAAAEGELARVLLAPRLGLTSVLVLREGIRARAVLVVAGGAGGAAVRVWVRAGETSREAWGDGELRECAPASVGGSLAPSAPAFFAVTGAAGAWCGSADSMAPVSDWKPSSSGVEGVAVMARAVGRMTRARVACWVQCVPSSACAWTVLPS
jgi:hypothetical protein